MSLPSGWIDRIFEKLQLAYGNRFLAQWSGLDVNVIKADWDHELIGFANHSDSIAYALQNLPNDLPLTAKQFRSLCRSAPAPKLKELPAPEADAENVKAAMKKAAEAVQIQFDPLSPIRRLRDRELAGDKSLTKFQREFWRIALKNELEPKT